MCYYTCVVASVRSKLKSIHCLVDPKSLCIEGHNTKLDIHYPAMNAILVQLMLNWVRVELKRREFLFECINSLTITLI